jgi:hypothetical protein
LRHIVVSFAPAFQGVGLGFLAATNPNPFGVEMACGTLSAIYYTCLMILGFAYVAVGPDLEFESGLDTFSTVVLKQDQEASRGRRGIAASLLRAVQLRFFYENVGDRWRRHAPQLRAFAAIGFFVFLHVAVLASSWNGVVRAANLDELLTGYAVFTTVSLMVFALTGGGARAALLSTTPFLRWGRLQISRGLILFLSFAFVLAIPPTLVGLVAKATLLTPSAASIEKAVALYKVIATYAVFIFGLALVFALTTNNPISATGATLLVLLAVNMAPLLWIPLFTSNVVAKETSWILDYSPFMAVWSVLKTTIPLNFTAALEDEVISHQHLPRAWPFFVSHLGVSSVLLGGGVVGAFRLLKRVKLRNASSALGAALAMVSLLVLPARAQDESSTSAKNGDFQLVLDVGFSGTIPTEGFAVVQGTLSSRVARPNTRVSLRDGSGNVVADFGPFNVPPLQESLKIHGVAPVAPLEQARDLTALATGPDGAFLGSAVVKASVVAEAQSFLVGLDRRGSFPFDLSRLGVSETPPAKANSGGKPVDPGRWTSVLLGVNDVIPVNALGWQGVTAILVGDPGWEKIREAEARALAGFVRRGGDLVISLGEQAQNLKRGALGICLEEAAGAISDLPPLRGVDVTSVLTGVAGIHTGTGVGAPATVAVLGPSSRQDRVLYVNASGKTLVIQRPLGHGRVIVLGFDLWSPPFRG